MPKWTYDAMYNWYTKQGKMKNSSQDTLSAIIYNSCKVSKTQKLEPFIKPHIKYVGKCPYQDKTIYPNTLFMVYDENKDGRQNLYFVHPTHTQCADKSVVMANHLSFLYDKYDQKNHCHFHSTGYACINIGSTISYVFKHFPDHFPSELTFPDDQATIIKRSEHQSIKPFLLKIIKHSEDTNANTDTQVCGAPKPAPILLFVNSGLTIRSKP